MIVRLSTMPLPDRGKTLALAAALLAVLWVRAPAFAQATIEDFVGTYVGTATVMDGAGQVEEERDMDVTISKTSDGFSISWINVTLVDGRRDVPGVKRRATSLSFRDEGKGRYVAEQRRSLFERRKVGNMFDGAPVSWARVEDNKLGVFSLVVLGDGTYELQVYERILTDQGLDIDYVRLDEGVPVRVIKGQTVRVGGPEDAEEDG